MVKDRFRVWKYCMGALLAAALVFSGVFGKSGFEKAAAAEFDFFYDGPVDMFTGEAIKEDSEVQTEKVNIPDGSVYDRSTGMYVYSLKEGTVSVSVADGMIVTGEVTLAKSEEAKILLFKNGKEMSEVPQKLSSPGSYVIQDAGAENAGQLMGFRILGTVTGAVSQYNLPKGFSVRSVTLDGENVDYDYGVVDLSGEGKYDISYICSDNGVGYHLTVTLDHTPPQVTFEGVGDDNRAKGPVTIKGLSEGDTVKVLFNGEETQLNSRAQLMESGNYSVTVVDPAGNRVERDFRIIVYLNMQAWMFVGLFLLVAIAVTGALMVARKRLRVR